MVTSPKAHILSASQWPSTTKTSTLTDGWTGVHFTREPYTFAFGSHVASGKITGTSRSDVVVSAKNSSLPHRVVAFLLFAGTTHTIVSNLEVNFGSMLLGSLATNGEGAYITSADATCDGLWVADVDGDAYADVVLSAGNKGRTAVVWGRAKSAFPAYVDADNCSSFDGVAVGVGDINADGRSDVFLNTSIVLGRADRALTTRLSLVLAGQTVTTAAPVGDVNGDGVVDTALGILKWGTYELVVVFGNSTNVPDAADGINVTGLGGFSAYDRMWTAMSVSGGFDADGDSVGDVLLATTVISMFTRSYIIAGKRGARTRVYETIGEDAMVTLWDRNSATAAVVASAGDINADGHADLAVALSRERERADVVVLLGPTNASTVTLQTIDGTTNFALEAATVEETDCTVAAAGDFNGDGLSDLFVLSPHAGGYEYETMERVDDMGRLYVLYGSASTRWPSFSVSLESIHSGLSIAQTIGLRVATTVQKAGFGSFAQGIGDSDGDAVPDILISAPKVLPKASGMLPGEHLVVSGHSGHWINSIDEQESRDIQETVQFTVCGGVGDFDGDGFSDIAVMKTSSSYSIRYGPALSSTRSVSVVAMTCPVGVGDVNGDGADDIAIRSTYKDFQVVFGGFGGSSIDADTSNSSSTGFYFGTAYAVARAGDVNCDGRDDIAVLDSDGVLWVVPGAAHFPLVFDTSNESAMKRVVNGVDSTWLLRPAAAGDVNGDGCGDLLYSLSDDEIYETSGERTVQTLIYFGNANLTAVNYTSPSTFGGRATIVHSSELAHWLTVTEDIDERPTSHGVGDVNGDGYADVVVPGRGCQVLFGKSDPWDPETTLEADGTTSTSATVDSENYVYCFPAGDVNNDSVADFIVSVQPDQDVWLYFGDRPPSQLQSISSLPGCCTASVGNAMAFSVDQAFSYTGDEATWTAQGMPSWLLFNASAHAFSGTPNRSSDALTSRVVVTLTDNHGMTATQEFSLSVSSSLVLSSQALSVQCSGSTCELPQVTVSGAHDTSVLALVLAVPAGRTGVFAKSGASSRSARMSARSSLVVSGNASYLTSFLSGLQYRDSSSGSFECQLLLSLSDEFSQNASVSLYATSRSAASGIRGAAIAGGVVGGAVLVALVGGVFAFVGLRRRRRRMAESGDTTAHHLWSISSEHWPAIREQLRERPDSNYVLVAATQSDTEFVLDAYSRCPVPGMAVGSIDVVYCPALERLFEARAHQLQGRSGNRAFEPAWQSEADAAVRAPVSDRLVRMTAPLRDGDFPDVQLLPLWHGTDKENLDSILRAGYANLAKTDVGFFGKGVYSTYEARYAHEVYSKGALVLNWVSFYSAYPVVEGDMLKLQGKGNFSNYDAHF
eukprot:m51a1_g8700 hypothetical protein (1354) ;mRNA; r:83730-87949